MVKYGMGVWCVVLSWMVAVPALAEITVTDTFDRANSTTLGSNWVDPEGAFLIFGNQAASRIANDNSNRVVQYSGTSVGTKPFTVHADVTFDGSADGVAFNIQDTRNYYALRMLSGGWIQLIKVVNGSVDGWPNGLAGSGDGSITISGDGAGNLGSGWNVRTPPARLSRSPLARVTKPARSIRALVSGVRSAK